MEENLILAYYLIRDLRGQLSNLVILKRQNLCVPNELFFYRIRVGNEYTADFLSECRGLCARLSPLSYKKKKKKKKRLALKGLNFTRLYSSRLENTDSEIFKRSTIAYFLVGFEPIRNRHNH
ncbi:unnamed protein product [Parnassius mnemosyne]|uniref:Uncharacterized protein n=1 Tax=Parnassius mnemosyne TaxID=213953 RepID=A0AAV1KEI5_9NEOP